MYTPELQARINELSAAVGVPDPPPLLEKIFACFLAPLARSLGFRVRPRSDFLSVSINLLLLSDGLSRAPASADFSAGHYLVALGFEQTAGMLPQTNPSGPSDRHASSDPLEDDEWYRLALAVLHYLAGDFRVQAYTTLARLRRISQHPDNPQRRDYWEAAAALSALYEGNLAVAEEISPRFATVFFSDTPSPISREEALLWRLARIVRERSGALLVELGLGQEVAWVEARGLPASAGVFWKKYLDSLGRRRITTFTRDQVGPGFKTWLRSNADLLVVLPTGAGKSLIGEIRTALSLANNEQAIWLLPTRALVRQTKRNLGRAFDPMGVAISELPTTEDVIPLFVEEPGEGKVAAATTPERLSALIRADPGAVANLGVLVFDEAQLLLEEDRGITAERVLADLHEINPQCRFVLMTAFADRREALLGLLRGLGREPVEIFSDSRPTRRTYGVIAPHAGSDGIEFGVSIYPPRPQVEDDDVAGKPYYLWDPRRKVASTAGATALARRFARETTKAGLRTVVFVGTKPSTESQARNLLGTRAPRASIPEGWKARLRIELGRLSAVEEAAEGIAPHHGGLRPLEQHVVETLVEEGLCRTVIATPTLAQGVNLPFDISIVTFLKRRNLTTGADEPLPISEVGNMLGRAGRAGYVADGICLITDAKKARDSQVVLRRNSRLFFGKDATSATLGIAALLARGISAGIASIEWLLNPVGLDFAEVQSLLHFCLAATHDRDDVESALMESLGRFPSLRDAEVDVAALVQLVGNLRQVAGEDTELFGAIEQTGLPVEFLRPIFALAREHRFESSTEVSIDWMDEAVGVGLNACAGQEWCAKLLCKQSPETILSLLADWRNGEPLATVERWWRGSKTAQAARLAVGGFLNHSTPLLSQLWGGVAIAIDSVAGEIVAAAVDVAHQVPALVRDGVPTVDGLLWLHALGGLDRVLANRLAHVSPIASDSGHGRAQRELRRRLQSWRRTPNRMPTGLDGDTRAALLAVLSDTV